MSSQNQEIIFCRKIYKHTVSKFFKKYSGIWILDFDQFVVL